MRVSERVNFSKILVNLFGLIGVLTYEMKSDKTTKIVEKKYIYTKNKKEPNSLNVGHINITLHTDSDETLIWNRRAFVISCIFLRA